MFKSIETESVFSETESVFIGTCIKNEQNSFSLKKVPLALNTLLPVIFLLVEVPLKALLFYAPNYLIHFLALIWGIERRIFFILLVVVVGFFWDDFELRTWLFSSSYLIHLFSSFVCGRMHKNLGWEDSDTDIF